MYKMAARSPFRAALFRDRVAVVTGGGSGIGAAVAAELLALECNVVIASRKIERLREAAEQLSAALVDSNPAKVTPIQCNIRKEDDVRNLMQKVLEFHGQIDYLVNNGGGQFISPAEHISTKGWNAVIDTNLTGTFLCCREEASINKHIELDAIYEAMHLWNQDQGVSHGQPRNQCSQRPSLVLTHGSSESSCGQPHQESGHRVGRQWGTGELSGSWNDFFRISCGQLQGAWTPNLQKLCPKNSCQETGCSRGDHDRWPSAPESRNSELMAAFLSGKPSSKL
ncbi:peroxisomal trans-2-enoyl-CoA reductase isoform X4 [Mobula hypostoma]|uniref:peroxisomal trans-2-enoyl-CoA reductase isoform X4 n=1 Tax=Mobula hypostoma TaxID=723540 RepID=UPI002FC2BE4F